MRKATQKLVASNPKSSMSILYSFRSFNSTKVHYSEFDDIKRSIHAINLELQKLRNELLEYRFFLKGKYNYASNGSMPDLGEKNPFRLHYQVTKKRLIALEDIHTMEKF